MRIESTGNHPVILDKSREMVKNSLKYSQPIFSDARYDAEISRYRAKRNFDVPTVERSPMSRTQTSTTLKKDLSALRISSKSPVIQKMYGPSALNMTNPISSEFPKHKFQID